MSKHTISHSIKLFFKRIQWWAEVVMFANLHSKEVDNYRFLMSSKNNAVTKQLELGRKEVKDQNAIDKLEIQIILLNKIINYTNGKR